jgi:diphthine methyl ester synthase
MRDLSVCDTRRRTPCRGRPFGATLHYDILLRARALNIPTDFVHNVSVMNAIGACGLQLYSFG